MSYESEELAAQMRRNPDLAKRNPGVQDYGPFQMDSHVGTGTNAEKKPSIRKHTEDDLLRDVIEVVHLNSWAAHHTRSVLIQTRQGPRYATPLQGDPGFPDLVLVRERPNYRGSTVLFRELKSNTGRLTPAEEFWRDVLVAAGADWAIWRPREWDRIVQELE